MPHECQGLRQVVPATLRPTLLGASPRSEPELVDELRQAVTSGSGTVPHRLEIRGRPATGSTAAGYYSWGMMAMDLLLLLAAVLGWPSTGNWFRLVPAN